MEKFMLPRKVLNIIVFCKAHHNASYMLKKVTKPEPVYAYKRHAYKKNMYIKQFCGFS